MTNSNSLLSKVECSAMRGVAIMCIMLHNFTHWLPFTVKENEYTFSQHNVKRLLYALNHPGDLFALDLFSFFGHYGVPVFLFLSAYGLTMKYEQPSQGPVAKEETPALSFIYHHFHKLFILMVVGFSAFLMYNSMQSHPHTYKFWDIVGQLTMTSNLFPHPNRVICPGPYWFFGLMVQFYVVYRLLMYRRHWAITVALMVACFLAQCFCEPEGDALNYLRYNFIGGMLPFGLGLLYARYGRQLDSKIVWASVLVVSSVLMVYGSQWYQTWFWVPIAVCAFSIALVKLTPSRINGLLSWVGGISSAIYLCHPITRLMFLDVSKHEDAYTGVLMYVFATLVLAIVTKRIFGWLEHQTTPSK